MNVDVHPYFSCAFTHFIFLDVSTILIVLELNNPINQIKIT